MSREAHGESIDIANAELNALSQRILATDEKQSEAFLAVAKAAEGSPNSNAQAALALTAHVGEMLTEMLGICAQAQEHLDAYRNEF